jgi:hypothetical protein
MTLYSPLGILLTVGDSSHLRHRALGFGATAETLSLTRSRSDLAAGDSAIRVERKYWHECRLDGP